jgi:phosphate uptake regulator
MVLEFFRGGVDEPLEEIEGIIAQMLLDDRHTFDLAINAVVGGTDAAAVGKEIRKSDRRVNKGEREVRRRLVVHASLLGKSTDLPRVLVSMSIVKDVERVGDESKNIWDIAHAGVDLSQADDVKWLTGLRDRTSRLIGECARIYKERDTEAAHALIREMDEILDEYDGCVQEQIESTKAPRDAVPRALLCRYLKRITAHLMNVLTSLVMPVHRLDYYDEKRAERNPGDQ